MEYLLKASAVIAIFYFCYKIFLQKETFFESNRWFLLIGLFIAFTIPMVVIPIYVTQTPIAIPNVEFTNVVNEKTVDTISVFEILSILYLVGLIFFTVQFLIQIWSLIKIFLKTKKQRQDKFILAKTEDNVSPFSFFKWIVFNPNQFEEDELNQILTHEKVHVNQLHSIDIMLSQIATIVFWFNPFSWLYKKDLQQNLEFIADNNTQNKVDCKKSYQYLLLKSSMPNHQLALTNNFYNSLIKKRIVMLHKSKSKQSKQLKYLLIIPFLSLFLMSFNTKNIYIEKEVPLSESNSNIDITEKPSAFIQAEPNINVTASEKQKSKTTSSNSNPNKNNQNIAKINADEQMVIITKDFTDNDFDKVKEQLKKEGLTVKFKSVKRNDSGEIISLKIDVTSKQSNANYNINGDEPIKPIKISFDREGGNISIGNSINYHFGKGTYSIRSKNGNKVHTIASDKNVIHIDSDTDIEFEDDKDIMIIKKDKDGNIVKEENIKEDEDILVVGDDNSYEVKSIGKGKNKVLLLNDEDGEPLIIIDGKEVTEEEMKELDPAEIEKMEVLKGNSATEKYGEKGENGVILITTK